MRRFCNRRMSWRGGRAKKKQPHPKEFCAKLGPVFLFCTILGNFEKYFEKTFKKMVGNEGFGYEVAMKGG